MSRYAYFMLSLTFDCCSPGHLSADVYAAMEDEGEGSGGGGGANDTPSQLSQLPESASIKVSGGGAAFMRV